MFDFSSSLVLTLASLAAGAVLPRERFSSNDATVPVEANENSSLALNSSASTSSASWGDVTWFHLGLGACGRQHSGQDSTVNVVALSAQVMGKGPTPLNSPWCGRWVTITSSRAVAAAGVAGGETGRESGVSAVRTVHAQVWDKCPECRAEDLDVSSKVFHELFGDLGVGRAKASWELHEPGWNPRLIGEKMEEPDA